MMERAAIFGAGGFGKRIYDLVKSSLDIVCFIDNDMNKVLEMKTINEIPIIHISELQKNRITKIIIGSAAGMHEIQNQLISIGIDSAKIDSSYVYAAVVARENFLLQISKEMKRENLNGAIAEAGVYRGEFAKQMNKWFSDRYLYLFDTFEGFSDRDVRKDAEYVKAEFVTERHMSNTSVEIVMSKMPHPEKCIIKAGLFPESTKDMTDELFCFVNIDMDMYFPTYEGLRFFAPRMVQNGVILIHDYFSDEFPNVRKAVWDYERDNKGLKKVPIGDTLSIALVY